ncbi:translation initiation factor IF-2-like [Oenanthe melanoleuca]|uniref:translation initiation factor IF-2-like n=1 Tax=Oenanthe melanoleuca TaxID=2939378 RepID=UPI0024C1EADD|nr:translation initiation factor IF-2-like [Oenanthe melanoleuca]
MLFPVTREGAGSKGGHEKRTTPFLCAPRPIKELNCGRPLALRFHQPNPLRSNAHRGAAGAGRTCGSADTSTATGTGPEEPRPPPRPQRRTRPVPPGPPERARANAAHERRPRAAAPARAAPAAADGETSSRHETPAGGKKGMRARAAGLSADVRGGSAFVYMKTTPRQAARARGAPQAGAPAQPPPQPLPPPAVGRRGGEGMCRDTATGSAPPARGSTASVLLRSTQQNPSDQMNNNKTLEGKRLLKGRSNSSDAADPPRPSRPASPQDASGGLAPLPAARPSIPLTPAARRAPPPGPALRPARPRVAAPSERRRGGSALGHAPAA